MKEHVFTHVKTTPQFFRFQEVNIETGEVLKKGDERAEFNFGCIYLKRSHFQIEPRLIKITVEAQYEED